MSNYLFRKEVERIKPYQPGKPVEELKREYGIEQVIKLASNENPLGPSPKAVAAIKVAAETVNIYPDDYGFALKEKLAAAFGLSVENIVLGDGGTEILRTIAGTFIDAGDEAVMPATTFGKYGAEVDFFGGKAVKIPLKSYQPDFSAMLQAVSEKTKLFYLCNPNNPTGNIVAKDEIIKLAAELPPDVALILDEAYYDYAVKNPNYGDSLKILISRPNMIILRTFSKIAGIAGVRIGYVLTSKEIASAMNKVKLTFGVNNAALAAAMAALDDREHIERTVALNNQSLALMEAYFDENKLEYIKSNANFIFVNLARDGREVFQKLLEKGIITRGGFLWGWDTWLRISTGTLEQTEIFLEKLTEVLTDIEKS